MAFVVQLCSPQSLPVQQKECLVLGVIRVTIARSGESRTGEEDPESVTRGAIDTLEGSRRRLKGSLDSSAKGKITRLNYSIS